VAWWPSWHVNFLCKFIGCITLYRCHYIPCDSVVIRFLMNLRRAAERRTTDGRRRFSWARGAFGWVAENFTGRLSSRRRRRLEDGAYEHRRWSSCFFFRGLGKSRMVFNLLINYYASVSCLIRWLYICDKQMLIYVIELHFSVNLAVNVWQYPWVTSHWYDERSQRSGNSDLKL